MKNIFEPTVHVKNIMVWYNMVNSQEGNVKNEKLKLDDLGRIVIPKPFRKELKLENESLVVVTLENNSVVIRPEKNYV